MSKSLAIIFSISLLAIFSGCSSTQETTKDEVKITQPTAPVDTTVKTYTETKVPDPVIEKPKVEKVTVYLVQLGAFSTQERAKTFSESAKKKLKLELEISFDSDTKLFNVSLPPFSNKEDAEVVKNQIKKHKEYNDVFIATKLVDKI